MFPIKTLQNLIAFQLAQLYDGFKNPSMLLAPLSTIHPIYLCLPNISLEHGLFEKEILLVTLCSMGWDDIGIGTH